MERSQPRILEALGAGLLELGRRAWRRAVRLTTTVGGGAEVFCGFKLFIWGGFVTLPARSFGTSAYGTLRALAPEYIHGGAALLVGAAILAMIDRRGESAWRARRALLFLALMIWCYVTIGFAMVNLFSTAVISYSLDAALAAAAYQHLTRRPPPSAKTS